MPPNQRKLPDGWRELGPVLFCPVHSFVVQLKISDDNGDNWEIITDPPDVRLYVLEELIKRAEADLETSMGHAYPQPIFPRSKDWSEPVVSLSNNNNSAETAQPKQPRKFTLGGFVEDESDGDQMFPNDGGFQGQLPTQLKGGQKDGT
jgi:hypothetical protein